MKKIIFGTLAYVIVTFPIAVMWHITIFKEQYLGFGHLPENPSFILGFLAILLQGILLTVGYNYTRVTVYKYVGLLGLFFWSSHVLAFMAKNPDARNFPFLGMETFYLAIQFGIYGILLAVINKRYPHL